MIGRLSCLTGLLYLSKALGTDVFEMEKPVVFTYEDIFSSTDGFSDSNVLGNGTYGSVYYGLLRDQVFTRIYFASSRNIYCDTYIIFY